VSLPGARYVLHNVEGISGTRLFYWLRHVQQYVVFHILANLPQGQLRFPSATRSVLLQYSLMSCRCLVPCMSNTIVQKLHGEVNCIGCYTRYSVSESNFSPMCLRDNSVSLLLHPQFFFNICHGPVAAWCQVCRIQLCKNIMEKLTVSAVIRATACRIPLFDNLPEGQLGFRSTTPSVVL